MTGEGARTRLKSNGRQYTLLAVAVIHHLGGGFRGAKLPLSDSPLSLVVPALLERREAGGQESAEGAFCLLLLEKS